MENELKDLRFLVRQYYVGMQEKKEEIELLKVVGKEKDKTISFLMDEIVELKGLLRKQQKATEVATLWYKEERGKRIPGKMGPPN